MATRLENAINLYLEAIRDGNYVEAINKYAGERYTQHSTPVKDGKDGFIEFFADFVQRNPHREIEIVRGFEDGQYDFLHAIQYLNGGELRFVTADIFDTDDNGRLIEHWDMITEWSSDTVSGHTQVDGSTEPTVLDQTDQNKALVERFLTAVLMNGEWDKASDYISTETFVQHNPAIGDGLDGLLAYVESLAERGESIVYEEVHKIVGQGNFVAAMSKLNLASIDTAAIDLFRVENDLFGAIQRGSMGTRFWKFHRAVWEYNGGP